MASKRLAAEVVEEINALDPNFFMQNPILLFQLKQVNLLLNRSRVSFSFTPVILTTLLASH